MLKKINKRYKTFYVLLIPCLIVFMSVVPASAGDVTLLWEAPTTNVDDTPLTDLAGYKVYYGTTSGSYDTVIDVGINVGDPPNYQVTNLTDSIFYYFVVTAYDTSNNESDYSNEVSKLIQALDNFTLTVSKNGTGTGTVMSSPAGIDCGTVCSANYNAGTIVTLTAASDTGSTFDGWSGACSDGTGACMLTINSDVSVTAQFTVCIDTDNDGFAIEGGDCGPIDCDDTNSAINPGANDSNCDGVDNDCNGITDDGYATTPTTCGAGICAATGQIECVGGTEVDTCAPGTPAEIPETTCDDTLDNDCDGATDLTDPDCGTLTYTITATAGSGGSISPLGAVIVDEDNDQTFTITPDTGYQILDVLIDGNSVGAVQTYTFTNVSSDYTIQATFKREMRREREVIILKLE